MEVIQDHKGPRDPEEEEEEEQRICFSTVR